jgi:hypothetical protein
VIGVKPNPNWLPLILSFGALSFELTQFISTLIGFSFIFCFYQGRPNAHWLPLLLNLKLWAATMSYTEQLKIIYYFFLSWSNFGESLASLGILAKRLADGKSHFHLTIQKHCMQPAIHSYPRGPIRTLNISSLTRFNSEKAVITNRENLHNFLYETQFSTTTENSMAISTKMHWSASTGCCLSHSANQVAAVCCLPPGCTQGATSGCSISH